MIGVLTISQSIGAFAMDKDVVYCSFGGPHELGSGLNYNMQAVVYSNLNTYLRTTMKADYYKGNVKLSSYTVVTESSNNSTKRTSASAYKSWTDTGNEVIRSYDKYYANAYRRTSSSAAWTNVDSKTGSVSSI